MYRLLDDGNAVIKLCQEMNHDKVIHCIINNSEIKNYIDRITNDKDSAKQVMHDTVLCFVRSCMKKDFIFKKNPTAYIKGIAKYINIKSKKNTQHFSDIDIDNHGSTEEFYQPKFELKGIVSQLLDKISDDCKEVLLLWALKYKMSEIAEKLNYTSEGYVKKKKHLCLKKLINVVEKDLKLKEELRLYV